MSADVFISYAWSSDEHRQWVRLLAAHMKAVGYDVLIDEDVSYGDSLSGFMSRAVDARHVLMVVDANYVHRADAVPGSGVEIENVWFKIVHDQKPKSWLAVLFKDNPALLLPAWLSGHDPKGHAFHADSFPGSEQVEELWRWIEDLPANRDHAVTAAKLRSRGARLEVIDRQRDPASWSNPALEGEVVFEYDKAPSRTYSLGLGEFRFELQLSGCGQKSVYVLRDPIHALGLNRSRASTGEGLAAQLTPGRTIVVSEGEQAILQNAHGALCLVDLIEVQREETAPAYRPASVLFRYRVLTAS